MRLFVFTLFLCAIPLTISSFSPAATKGINQNEHAEPFFVQYKELKYQCPEPPASDDELNHVIKKLTREMMAKGVPEAVAQRKAKQSAVILKESSSGTQEVVQYFGAGANAKLWGDYNAADVTYGWWPNGFMPRCIVKTDRQLMLQSVIDKNGHSYQRMKIRPVDAKNPPEKITNQAEAVIFGLEAVESLFQGKSYVTKGAGGQTISGPITIESTGTNLHTKAVIDAYGRIALISISDQGHGGSSSDVWTASDFVRANKGWVPKVATRRYIINNKIWATRNYKLTKLETGQKVIDKWFLDKVDQPTFVYDSRYNGVTIKYFTKDRLLPDDEVERRARSLVASQNPLRLPKNPWRIGGILLITIGTVVLIRRVGWPKRRNGQGNS